MKFRDRTPRDRPRRHDAPKKAKKPKRRPREREPEPEPEEAEGDDVVDLLTDVRDVLVRLLVIAVCPMCRGGGRVVLEPKTRDGYPWCEPCSNFHIAARDLSHHDSLHCKATWPIVPVLVTCRCRVEALNFLNEFPAEMLSTGPDEDPEDYATCSACGRVKKDCALEDGECSCGAGREGSAEWVMQGDEPEEEDHAGR